LNNVVDDLVFRVDPAKINTSNVYPALDEVELAKSYATLCSIDLRSEAKTKKTKSSELTYIPWSSVWAEIKKVEPTARYNVYPQIMDNFGNTRFWHDDGKSGWVEVGVSIKGLEHVMTLAVMDFRNQSIPAENITSTDANKSMMRCLVKACAMHGIGMYIYKGEEIPDNEREVLTLQNECYELVVKKCALSEKAKSTVGDLCKASEVEADPLLPEDAITGNPKNIRDAEVLNKLKKQLMAVRK